MELSDVSQGAMPIPALSTMAKVRCDANIHLLPCESSLGNVFLTFEMVCEQEHGQLPQLNQWQLIKALQITYVSAVTNRHLILPAYWEAGCGFCRRDLWSMDRSDSEIFLCYAAEIWLNPQITTLFVSTRCHCSFSIS